MAATVAEGELKKYEGNCHCGQFHFTLNIPKLQKVTTCNCSICQRNAYMWISPNEDAFVITQGEGTLKTYEFGKRSLAHQFCPKCGTSVLAIRHNAANGRSIFINARTIKDLDLDTLEIQLFPGADLDPAYKAPDPVASTKEAEAGNVLYNGNCHCGAVSYVVENKPLTEIKVLSCNCSLCSRNGDLWIYPAKTAVEVRGGENLTDYAFLQEDSLHSFCSTCGVSVLVRITVPGAEDMPINVRTINGIDLAALQLNKYNGRKNDPQYTI